METTLVRLDPKDRALVDYAVLSARELRLQKEREQCTVPVQKAQLDNRLRGIATKLHKLEERHPDLF